MLVINDCKCLVSFSKVLHSKDKVLTIVTEYPRSTNDVEVRNMFLNKFFTHAFCTSVLCLWVWFIINFPFLTDWFFTIKNVVCWNINKRCTILFWNFSDIFSSCHVNSIVKFFALIFSGINCSISCTVVDQTWLHFCEHFVYFFSICNVHLCYVYCYILFVAFVKKVTKFSSELAICTCY